MVEDLEIYGFKIDADAVRAGLARAQWPCSFEVFPGGKDTATVVIDAAHTAESAAACADTFEAVYPDRKAVVVFGTGTDKDARGMARALARVAQQVVVTRSDHPRALDIDIATAKSFLGPVPVTRAAGTSEALEIARRLAGPGGVVLVAGSIFLAAEARQYL